jgi:hypothetical protein
VNQAGSRAEDGGVVFFRDVSWLPFDYLAVYPRRQKNFNAGLVHGLLEDDTDSNLHFHKLRHFLFCGCCLATGVYATVQKIIALGKQIMSLSVRLQGGGYLLSNRYLTWSCRS